MPKTAIVFLNGKRGFNVLPTVQKLFPQVVVVILRKKPKLRAELKKKYQESIKIISTENINSQIFVAKIKQQKPDVIIVAGFPQIFGTNILHIPKNGAINLHGGPLPQYRGGSPLNWQIINGEKKIGVSALLMDEGIDTGRVLASARFFMNSKDTIREVHIKANVLFGRILRQAVNKVMKMGRSAGLPQSTAAACYWHQRTDEDGELCCFSMSSKQVLSKIRALSHPYPGAWARFRGRKVRIFKAERPAFRIRGSPGKVFFLKGKGPFVVCRDQALLLTKTRPLIKRQAPTYLDR